jgi:hypothetical protein
MGHLRSLLPGRFLKSSPIRLKRLSDPLSCHLTTSYLLSGPYAGKIVNGRTIPLPVRSYIA